MEFFGGKDTTGSYTLQKLLLTDVGLPFCTTPLSNDPEVKAFWTRWAGGGDVIAQQAASAVKKDVIAPGSASGTRPPMPPGSRSSSTGRRPRPLPQPWPQNGRT